MNTYNVEIKSIRKATIEVQARSEELALALAEDMYSECEVDYDDLDHDISIEKPESKPDYRDIETMIIKVEQASDGEGYMYDIFMNREAFEDDNSIDGGQCTTNIDNALDMAIEQAKTFTKKG